MNDLPSQSSWGGGSARRINSLEHLALVFDYVLASTNVRRSLECKLNSLVVTRQLDIEWLKSNEQFMDEQRGKSGETTSDVGDNRFLLDQTELTLAWLFHARQVLHSNTINSSSSSTTTTTGDDLLVERVLNVLSNALEANPNRELVWLLYLKTYLCKRNASADYHEICLLCLDNLVTYDLVWLILNTCPVEYVELVVDRYEKYLLSCSHADLVEFEQQQEQLRTDHPRESNRTSDNSTRRVSYYLFELILFNVYFQMNMIVERPSLIGSSASTNSNDKLERKTNLALAKDYLNR